MMQIQVAGKHIELGEALPQRVRTKLATAVEKHFDGNAEAHVTFMKERSGFRADCSLHLSSGATVQAHGNGPDAHRAFDMALDHLETRVSRYTRRHKNHHHDRQGQIPSGMA